MKTFAVYIYHKDKKGFEQYEYCQEIITTDPETEASEIYLNNFNRTARTKTYDMQIKINDVKFNSFTVAFNGIDKEIILAGRMNN